MHYKTIVLELIQDQYPALHEQLRASRLLLLTLDTLASDLKASHEAWTERYCEAIPGKDRRQMAADALEAARSSSPCARLPCESQMDEAEPLSLDAAMNFIRRHTSPA